MFSVAWQDIPREQNPEYLPLSSTPEMKRLIMGTGIIYLPKKVKHRIRDKIKIQLVQRQKKWSAYPIFSAPDRFWKATPATLSPMIAGPPLLPGLIAASICIAMS
jgi:hypothetical protein